MMTMISNGKLGILLCVLTIVMLISRYSTCSIRVKLTRVQKLLHVIV